MRTGTRATIASLVAAAATLPVSARASDDADRWIIRPLPEKGIPYRIRLDSTLSFEPSGDDPTKITSENELAFLLSPPDDDLFVEDDELIADVWLRRATLAARIAGEERRVTMSEDGLTADGEFKIPPSRKERLLSS